MYKENENRALRIEKEMKWSQEIIRKWNEHRKSVLSSIYFGLFITDTMFSAMISNSVENYFFPKIWFLNSWKHEVLKHVFSLIMCHSLTPVQTFFIISWAERDRPSLILEWQPCSPSPTAYWNRNHTSVLWWDHTKQRPFVAIQYDKYLVLKTFICSSNTTRDM